MRRYTHEPLAARPFSYVKSAIAFGIIIHQWDYLRRVMLENVLEREQENRYFRNVQSLNHHVRVGDEDSISNLTDYLAGKSTRV